MSFAWKFLRDFFLSPSDGRALAGLRIVLGVAALIECALIFPYLEPLYGQYGFLQADLIEALTGGAIPGFFARHGFENDFYLKVVTALYILHMVFAFTFAIGYRTRLSAVGLWLSQTVIMASGYYSSYGVDRYFQNFFFLFACVPAPRVWSVDSLRAGIGSRRSAFTFGLRLMQLFLLLTYLDAGISKSMGQDWWTGEAIWRVLNQPEFRRFDFSWLSALPYLPKVLGWGTMLLESGYLFAAFTKKLGPWWTLGIVCLHLGIAFTMEGLTLFGFTLAAVNAALFWLPRFLPEGQAAEQNTSRPLYLLLADHLAETKQAQNLRYWDL